MKVDGRQAHISIMQVDTGISYADGGKTQLKNSRGPLSEHVLTPWKYSTNEGGHWSLEFFETRTDGSLPRPMSGTESLVFLLKMATPRA